MPSLEGYRPASIAVHASTLRSFLTYLHFHGILKVDLSGAVDRPRLYRWSDPPHVLDAKTIEPCSNPWTVKAAVKAEKDRKAAPDFALKDINGQTVHISDYKGITQR